MNCSYLSIYSGSDFHWQVASCASRKGRYIPSLSDLKDFCQGEHSKCPYFMRSLPEHDQFAPRGPVAYLRPSQAGAL